MTGLPRWPKKTGLSFILLPASVIFFLKASRCPCGCRLEKFAHLWRRLGKMRCLTLHQPDITLVRRLPTMYCHFHYRMVRVMRCCARSLQHLTKPVPSSDFLATGWVLTSLTITTPVKI